MKQGSFATTPAPPDVDQFVTANQLSRLSGVSLVTIRTLAKGGMIPKPVRYDGDVPIFDLADAALAEWLCRLQSAGYDRRS